jgi:hypothetical protein
MEKQRSFLSVAIREKNRTHSFAFYPIHHSRDPARNRIDAQHQYRAIFRMEIDYTMERVAMKWPRIIHRRSGVPLLQALQVDPISQIIHHHIISCRFLS